MYRFVQSIFHGVQSLCMKVIGLIPSRGDLRFDLVESIKVNEAK